MTPPTVSVLEGNTFVVSARNGDIDGSPAEPHGLFHRDTRFLSRLVLTVDGEPLQALSTDDLEYFEAQFFLVPGGGSAYTRPSRCSGGGPSARAGSTRSS